MKQNANGVVTIYIVIALIAVVAVAITAFSLKKVELNNDKKIALQGSGDKKEKKDDWKYDVSKGIYDGGSGIAGLFSNGFTSQSGKSLMTLDTATLAPAIESSIGFSVGGAKDINNFRENIENGYFPILTDITYNGLFYDYTFDTGMKNKADDLFSPSYSLAISKDPISGLDEQYMTVGLNSNIKAEDFSRKKLNLVVVLDISGSMSSSLSDYYYDDPFASGKEREYKSKMQAANESVNILIDQLKDDDRFGMVLFDDRSYLAKELNLVGETDIEAIKEHVLEIQAQGGTNFEAGYKRATSLFDDLKNIDSNEYENRVIIITDAMPNYGEVTNDGLLGMIDNNAKDGIYTTFVGVGVDFNTKLIETITNVKGANYYSVHTSKEFEERMGEQFEFMVTPLVFDLELNLHSDDYEIVGIYGSDTINKETGNVLKVNTLFPSKTEEGEVKGGVVLLKLKKIGEGEEGEVKLDVAYKDRNGKAHSNSQIVTIKDEEEHYDNTGIRKAILLTRYANTLKNWILYERSEEPRFLIVPAWGICDCAFTEEEIVIMLGEHERMSVELEVSSEYGEIFEKLKGYMVTEIEEVGDKTLEKEIEILDKLVKKAGLHESKKLK